jgi:hypothetical protein
MQVSYWFSIEEKLPANSGVYLACGMYLNKPYSQMVPNLYFWNADELCWFKKDQKSPLKNLKVIYWTFSDPYIWYQFDYPQSVPALNNAAMAAMQEVRDAIDKFNLLKNLCNTKQ